MLDCRRQLTAETAASVRYLRTEVATVKKAKRKAPRNHEVLGMILTTKRQVFRHRADRRPKDARRTRDWDQ